MGSLRSRNDSSWLIFQQNFTELWKIYQNSGKNAKLGLCSRDYALLDEIYLGRIRSLKQWMEKVGYDGDASCTFEAEFTMGFVNDLKLRLLILRSIRYALVQFRGDRISCVFNSYTLSSCCNCEFSRECCHIEHKQLCHKGTHKDDLWTGLINI